MSTELEVRQAWNKSMVYSAIKGFDIQGVFEFNKAGYLASLILHASSGVKVNDGNSDLCVFFFWQSDKLAQLI